MRILRIISLTSLVAIGLFVALRNMLTARGSVQALPASDSVSRWENRVESALEHIPDDTRVIGYVADWDIPGMEYDLIDQDTEYTLTQYALAPRIVQPGLDHEWVIGNFTGPDFREWLDQELSSYEITEIGFGIYVIHNSST